MNKDKIIKDLKKRNDSLKMQYEYRNIRCIHLEKENERLQQENQQLKKQKDELQKEMDYVDDYNRHLLKQKDDVVESAKEKIKRYESYIHDLKNGNYPNPTVRQERQELIFRIREQEDLLRMLGERDEKKNKRNNKIIKT